MHLRQAHQNQRGGGGGALLGGAAEQIAGDLRSNIARFKKDAPMFDPARPWRRLATHPVHLKQTIIDEERRGLISRGDRDRVLERIEENLKVYNGAARAMNEAVRFHNGVVQAENPKALEDLCTAVRNAGRDAGHVCLEVQGQALDWRSIKTAEKFIRWDREEERNRLIYGGDEETQSSYEPTDSGSEDEDEASRPEEAAAD